MSTSNDLIMERISRLDHNASVGFRSSFYRHNSKHEHRWYVNLGQVVYCYPKFPISNYSSMVFGFAGASPEEAIQNAWQTILKDSRTPDCFYARFECHPNQSIQDSKWFMLCRWNEFFNDWENAKDDILANFPEDRIRFYRSGSPDSG